MFVSDIFFQKKSLSFYILLTQHSEVCVIARAKGYQPSIRNWQSFSVKVQVVSILGFVLYMVAVTTIRLCHQSMKASIGNIYVNRCRCVLINLYLQNIVGRQFLVCGLQFASKSSRIYFESNPSLMFLSLLNFLFGSGSPERRSFIEAALLLRLYALYQLFWVVMACNIEPAWLL